MSQASGNPATLQTLIAGEGQPPNSGKPGHKTSEFWMIAIAMGLVFFGDALGIEVAESQEVIAGSMAVLYGVGRSFVKGFSK